MIHRTIDKETKIPSNNIAFWALSSLPKDIELTDGQKLIYLIVSITEMGTPCFGLCENSLAKLINDDPEKVLEDMEYLVAKGIVEVVPEEEVEIGMRNAK